MVEGGVAHRRPEIKRKMPKRESAPAIGFKRMRITGCGWRWFVLRLLAEEGEEARRLPSGFEENSNFENSKQPEGANRTSKREPNTKSKKQRKAVHRLGNKGKDCSPNLPTEYLKREHQSRRAPMAFCYSKAQFIGFEDCLV